MGAVSRLGRRWRDGPARSGARMRTGRFLSRRLNVKFAEDEGSAAPPPLPPFDGCIRWPARHCLMLQETEATSALVSRSRVVKLDAISKTMQMRAVFIIAEQFVSSTPVPSS